ncbi:MAG: hypothetical protein IJL92_10290, partial [Thermoguttaceae bacterium]|nr:hypothetical protein [Thermoguttaceae bacterium]
MTKNRKSSLFSNHSSRRSEKRAPRGTSLRFEALENRELLSVNAADYAQLRESFDQLALPENFNDVNVIELSALTAEALQNAINDAATTPQDDLIVVDPTELGENTLSLADATIVVDFDASEFGAVTLVSTGDERLQISVNPEDYSFDFRSGVLNFAGLDFVAVADMGLLCTIDAQALDAELVDSLEQDVRYFDVDGLELIEETRGGDVFDSFENVYAMQDGVELEIQEATWNRDGAWTNNYAVIFIGHYNDATENAYFKRLATRLYNTLIDDYGLLPKDVYVFYAGGEQFIRGVNVQPATLDNLDNCLAKLNREMNSNSRLLAFIDDHGGGGSPALGDETIVAQGYDVSARRFSTMIRQIKSGYVTCALGCCHSGGVLEVTKDNVVHDYDGGAHFSIGASSTYDESAHYATKGTFLYREWRWRGFKSGYYYIYAGEDLSWSDSFVNALDAGIVSSGSLFANAENNYYARKGEDHPYHWNSQRVFNTTISGAPTTKLSSPSPSIKSVTDKTITVTWEPSYFSGYMVRPSEISYVVQWRRYDSDSWNSRTILAYEYETNNKSFTIRSFDGAPLEGGVTYDVTVYARKDANTRSVNSRNITATPDKRLAESLYDVVDYWKRWNRNTTLAFTTSCNANSIDVALTSKPSDASGYTIKCLNLETNVETSVVLSASATGYSIKGLTDGSRYRISVKANGGKYDTNLTNDVFRFCDSNWKTKTVYTPKKLIAPDLRMGDDSTDVMSTVTPKGDVSWRGGAIDQSLITGYEYRYREVGSSTWLTYGEPTTTYVSPNLPSGRYEFQFRALGNNLKDGSRNATVDSEWSSIYITEVAKRFVVTTLADDPNHTGSLRYAINHLADKDMIILAPERIVGYSSANKTIRLDSTMTITRSVTIDASRCMNADGTPGLIIDANGKQAFNFGANATNVSINGLTIKNASTTERGGAIYSDAQNLSVTNCVFENNYSNAGAAIFTYGVSTTEHYVTIRNSVFIGNDSLNSGGAIFVKGDNRTSGVKGGEITISDSRFISNTSNSVSYTDGGFHGGGAVFINADNVWPITIERTEFVDNESTTSGGGAVAFDRGTTATVKDCVFDGNTAPETGGAISSYSGNLSITGSTFTNNSAFGDGTSRIGYGGAVFASGTNVSISFSEFSGNECGWAGGALLSWGAAGSVSVETVKFHGNNKNAIHVDSQNTFINNSLFYDNPGRAIYYSATEAASTLTLQSSTIADNRGTASVVVNNNGKKATFNALNSIILPTIGDSGLAVSCNDTANATNVLSTNPSEWTSRTNFWTYDRSKPLFTDAANGDYTLAANSQAFNRGTDLYATSDAAMVDAMRDLAGAPRQVGGRVDLGAYELQTYETRTWTVTSALDALEEGTLRYALMNAHEG